MKNLLFILAFVLIGSAGFSQTFTLSTSAPGVTQQFYTVSIPTGTGYNYTYNISAQKDVVYIVSYYQGTIAMLDNPAVNMQSISGSGSVPIAGGRGDKQYSDVIFILISNALYSSYGYASITVYPY